MKAIMYHYVREFNANMPDFRYLDRLNFARQLDFFSHQGFCSRSDWGKNISTSAADYLPNQIMLTFDDGTRCHFDFVLQELRKRKLWAHFYIPAQPYITGEMLVVHKIHLLCGSVEISKLMALLTHFLDKQMIQEKKYDEFMRESYQNQIEVPKIIEFKRILNYFCLDEWRNYLVDRISEEIGFSFPGREFYMSPQQIKKLASFGNIIGSHTVTHPVMSKLDKDSQLREINQSFEYLESIVDQDIITYCHPYGGSHTFNQDTVELLESRGVNYSFSVEARDIKPGDLISLSHYLPRYDCNVFPFGKVSPAV